SNCGACGNVCVNDFGYNDSVDQTAICCQGNCTPKNCGCPCSGECCATADAGQFVCCPNGCHETIIGAQCSA
ncbi:MAG: hypothetical protein ACRDNS_03065, partial [Trebonia sp.]